MIGTFLCVSIKDSSNQDTFFQVSQNQKLFPLPSHFCFIFVQIETPKTVMLVLYELISKDPRCETSLKACKETKGWTNLWRWHRWRHSGKVENSQTCHSRKFYRPDNTHKWRISGQPWKHVCWKQRKWSGEGSFWHVQQLCGCRPSRVLWSSVLRCDRVLAESESVAGLEAEAGRAHMVSVRAWERAPAVWQKAQQTPKNLFPKKTSEVALLHGPGQLRSESQFYCLAEASLLSWWMESISATEHK